MGPGLSCLEELRSMEPGLKCFEELKSLGPGLNCLEELTSSGVGLFVLQTAALPSEDRSSNSIAMVFLIDAPFLCARSSKC